MVKVEIPNYTKSSILEELYNCIAHQDYTMNSRVVVTEYPDKLVFENAGNFYERSAYDYFTSDQVIAKKYQNTCLASAMVSLDMIERAGFGIRGVFYGQVDRYLPLPDYIETSDSVTVNLYGSPIDNGYTEIMLENFDLSPEDLLCLDAVQKGNSVDEKVFNSLRNRGFITGRKPNYYLVSNLANKNDDVNDYDLRRKVIDVISASGSASRSDIEHGLEKDLEDMPSDVVDKKINAVITALKREGSIKNIGSRKGSKWVIVEK
ncbi:MAG: hypothetical protein LBQ41_01935 [Candidatus Ancillula sp.]|nr:hypothetical protein [Candidatus Ancillula sp.]